MYGSYISSRMLNTFSYGSNFSQLPKRDNLLYIQVQCVIMYDLLKLHVFKHCAMI